jgi:putative ABC transport system permease protein
MLIYNLRLAWISLSKTPVLSVLMISAIGIGIGVCMTIITVYALMSNDPVPAKSKSLYTYELDNHLTVIEGQEEEDPSSLVGYRDVMNMSASTIPEMQSIHYQTTGIFKPSDQTLKPFREVVRLASWGFFEMFDVPFKYGSGWDQSVEEKQGMVVVLGEDLNDRLFGGENSIGRRVELAGRYFEVVGVMDQFSPIPRYYEVDGNFFDDTEGAFIPFSLTPVLELQKSGGSTMCMRDPESDGFASFLESECNWIHHWVKLPTTEDRDAYLDMLTNYSIDQRKRERFQGPFRNRIYNVNEWLEYKEIVNPAYVMLIGVAFMFLSVCLLNTNGLLFAKFTGRAGDISVRRALGCSKKRMFIQHLVEIGMVGLLGGLFGLLLATAGLFWLKEMFVNYENLANLNVELVGFAIGVSILSTLIAGLYPAWRICQLPPAQYLKSQ